jgi:hypothetical protein
LQPFAEEVAVVEPGAIGQVEDLSVVEVLGVALVRGARVTLVVAVALAEEDQAIHGDD